MSTILDAVVAMPSWQRARINRITVDGHGRVTVSWLGLVPLADPGVGRDGELPEGVEHQAWAAPDDQQLGTGVMDPEKELHALRDSGVLGDMTIYQATAPDTVAWTAQTWDSQPRTIVAAGVPSAAMMLVLAADAEVRLARYLVKEADRALSAQVATALSEGVSAPKIAVALGVSRGRVYQIRDGRR